MLFRSQSDGRYVLLGTFTSVNGESRTNIARLNATGPALQSLVYDDDKSTITWLRSGTCPEVAWTLFDFSTYDTDWQRLGVGTRIPGGWRLTGASVPAGAVVRVHGVVGSAGRVSGNMESKVVARSRKLQVGMGSVVEGEGHNTCIPISLDSGEIGRAHV